MRVTDGRAKPREAADAGRTKRFGEALRTASRAASTSRPAAGGGGAALPARVVSSRRAFAGRADDALRDRRDGFREEARATAPQPPSPGASAPEPITAPELHALVRTLPLAIRTFGLRDGAPLELSFGRSLDVEIRAAPRGVELLLRPEPRLARAAEAELRSVVAALGAKGIAVARAEVRARGSGAATGRGPRVDLPPGVR